MEFKGLIGKTITEATLLKYPETDDEAWLRLRFTDGTECVLQATYGGWTGYSMDEYPAYIRICQKPHRDLVPVCPVAAEGE
jgi:hypothetical protein